MGEIWRSLSEQCCKGERWGVYNSESSECWWSVVVRCSVQADHMDLGTTFCAFSSSVEDTLLFCLDWPQPRYSLVFTPRTPHRHIIGMSHHLDIHVYVYKWDGIAFVCVYECALCHAQIPGLFTAHCTWHWPTASSTQCKSLSARDHTCMLEYIHASVLLISTIVLTHHHAVLP